MIRALIVDDEEPARERLRMLLRAFSDIEILSEAADGVEAIEKIAELRPDLVFLDIQMPECSGLEVAAALADPAPAVIFCTAFDQYAIEAFELHALDYLLKPVSRSRLARAVERIRKRAPKESGSGPLLEKLPHFPKRFLGSRGSRYRVIDHAEVLCFISEDGLTKLCSKVGEFWIQPSLNDLEKRLNPAEFLRVSRSAILRLGSVQEVLPLPGGVGEVVMNDGRRLEVSRRRFRELIERLGGT